MSAHERTPAGAGRLPAGGLPATVAAMSVPDASATAVRERQPRRDRTRDALVRAGQRLFSERPIEIISIDDIVQAADVAKGTFYNHFNDKDDFEHAILQEARLEMEGAIQTAFAGDPDPAVRMAIAACVSVRFAHDHPNRARLIVRHNISGTALHSELNSAMLHDVSLGIVSGRFTVPTVEIGALAVLGLGNVGIIRALELADILAKVALGQQLATMLLRALGLPGEEAYKIAARAAERIIRVPSPVAQSPGESHRPAPDVAGRPLPAKRASSGRAKK